MRQSFEEAADRSFAGKHLPRLRAELERQGLDGLIVPHEDEHQNEYLPDANERLAWVSGFTGSAGAAVVLKDRAAIFTDGRYTVQVRDQVDPAHFEYLDLVDGGPPAEIRSDGIEFQHCARHWPTIPRFSLCDMASAITLTAMTMVASALISGVMPKRIIE